MKKSMLYIASGSFLIASGINFFLLPEKISTGGVSGIGTILYYILSVPLSVTTLIINLILILFGIKYLSKTELLKTVAGIVLCSVFLEILPILHPFGNDRLISSVCGGIIVGTGLGLVISVNASTGGSDLAAIMIKKLFPFLSVSYIIFFIDAVIITISGIIFKDFIITFYSVLSLFMSAKIADLILVKGDFAKSVMIISDNCNEIAEVINSKLERGVTGIYGKGMYYKEDKTILLCVLKPKEIPDLKHIVYSIDKNAFIIIFEAREVLGEGFKKV